MQLTRVTSFLAWRVGDAAWRASALRRVADIVALAKPRITLMVVITTAGGLFLSRRVPMLMENGVRVPSVTFGTALATLVGTALIVAGANALNMYLERDVDRRMDRTKRRPLPAGRLAPSVALSFGV